MIFLFSSIIELIQKIQEIKLRKQKKETKKVVKEEEKKIEEKDENKSIALYVFTCVIIFHLPFNIVYSYIGLSFSDNYLPFIFIKFFRNFYVFNTLI